MSMTAFRALVRKDLQLFFVDRRALIMSFAAPIAIASFFGFLFGGHRGKTEASRIPVRIVDTDGSALSREVARRLAADPALDARPASADEARAAVRSGKVVVAVVFPAGFGDAAARAFFNATEKKPELPLLHDPSRAAELAMIRGILTQHVMEAVSKEVFGGGAKARELTDEALARLERDDAGGMAPADRQALRELLTGINRWYGRTGSSGGANVGPRGLAMPYEVREEAVTAGPQSDYNGFAHSFAGMGVQFMMFGSIELGIAILTQRQRGLWKRLRAAPLSRGMLLGSRTASGTLIGFLILMVIFGFAAAVFGVRIQGSMLGFLGVCAACALMSTTFGLLVAALGKTPEATRGIAIFATLIVVMLGGAWVPSFIFPSWLQKATLLVPTRWAIDGLDGATWRGLGLLSALPAIAVLLGFAALFGGLAVARFRWEAE